MKHVALFLILVAAALRSTVACPVTFDIFPARPAEASALSLASGIFTSYHLLHLAASAGSTVTIEAVMSIKDAETGTIREFRLSVHPRLNGRPLACSDPRSVDQHVVEMSDCKQIDRALIPGVTHVAVLFWPVTTMGQAIQVTDEIATL